MKVISMAILSFFIFGSTWAQSDSARGSTIKIDQTRDLNLIYDRMLELNKVGVEVRFCVSSDLWDDDKKKVGKEDLTDNCVDSVSNFLDIALSNIDKFIQVANELNQSNVLNFKEANEITFKNIQENIF